MASSAESVVRARALLASGDTSGALSRLDEALRLDPENADALMALGSVMHSLDRDEEAAAAFRRAADLQGDRSPQGLDALCALADALARQGKSREAIEALQRVRAAAPARRSVHHDLGRIYLVVGELDAAARAFREELALPATPVEGGKGADAVIASSWEGLGLAAYRMGDDAAALEALAKGSPTVEARFHTGLALARQERHEEALAAFKDALAREPGHRGALQAAAKSAGALRRDDERQAALRQFADLYRKDETDRARHVKILTLRTQADSLGKEGNAAGAVAKLEEAAALAPDDMQLQLSLGRLQHAAKDPRAETTFLEVLRREPMNAEARYRLGRLLAERGNVDGALAALEQACRVSPMTLSYHVQLAQLYLRAGRTDDGVRELRLTRRLAPSDPESAYNLGLGLAQAGSLKEAAAELETAVSQGYADPRVHQVLAQVHTRLGDAEAARRAQETYERMMRERPPR